MEVQPQLLDVRLVDVVLTWRDPLLSHEFLQGLSHPIRILLLVEVGELERLGRRLRKLGVDVRFLRAELRLRSGRHQLLIISA